MPQWKNAVDDRKIRHHASRDRARFLVAVSVSHAYKFRIQKITEIDSNVHFFLGCTVAQPHILISSYPHMLPVYQEYLKRNEYDEKEYQMEAIAKMRDVEVKGVEIGRTRINSGMLADEMGLGKTAQMIGLILENFKRRTLIVLPRALLEQWDSAISDGLGHDCCIFHGQQSNRQTTVTRAPIVLTTYGKLTSCYKKRNEKKVGLYDVHWDRVIFDEAHHLRSPSSLRHKAARELRCRHMWLVTGTPIQNHVSDLYNLLGLLGVPRPSSQCIEREHMLPCYRGIFIRRTKADVGLGLPPIQKRMIEVEWDSEEEKNWSADVHSLVPFSGIDATRPSKFGKLGLHHFVLLQRARQCCTDMIMLRDDIEELKEQGVDVDEESVIGFRSKLNKVLEIIISRRGNGNRKLVFCHYRSEIDCLKAKLESHNVNVAAFDGRIKQAERKAIVDDHSLEIIILQIQTGCEGLNLQHFNEIFFTTCHWNPGVEDQAVARCHRIGQTKPVEVFMFKMASFDQDRISRTLDSYVKTVQRIKRGYTKHVEDPETSTLLDDKCAICLNKMKSHETCETDCGHMFHRECLSEWRLRSNSCPTCRDQM